MTHQHVSRTNQQSKSDTPLVSGILQRAAVRNVPVNEVESKREEEATPFRPSGFSYNFSEVPVSTGEVPKKQSKLMKRSLFDSPQQLSASPLQAKLTIGQPGDQYEAEVQRPNRTGLPDDLKSGIENLSGISLDDVKVHYNSSQPAQLKALAYTQGSDIYVAPGQEKHLPHEAWHVVQQAQGRVQPTMQMKDGVPVNDDKGLEHEADVMGAKALGSAVQPQGLNERELLQRKLDPMQRQGVEEEELLQANDSSSVKQATRFREGALFKRDSEPIQRTIEEDLQALEDVYQKTDDPLLERVLHEVRLLSDVEFTSVDDPEEGHAERQTGGSTLAHLINLDPQITDPETRQSLILHELIHVSADRKYNVNQTGEPEPALTAVVNPHASEQVRLEDIRRQNKYREELATHLASVVKGDWVIDEKAAQLVLDRVPRIQGASHREFDSVITELYYRLKKMGVDERTDTFKEVAAMTAAAYRSRHEGRPLDQTYREPMKTGFLG